LCRRSARTLAGRGTWFGRRGEGRAPRGLRKPPWRGISSVARRCGPDIGRRSICDQDRPTTSPAAPPRPQ
jgi:hypothetical protein